MSSLPGASRFPIHSPAPRPRARPPYQILKRPAAILLALLLSLVPLLAPPPARAQEPAPPYDPSRVPLPDRPPSAGQAADLYAQNCAPCHGAAGGGDGPARAGAAMDPTVFADPAALWERSPAELFFVTKFGRIEKLMPPWQNSMGDEQIWQTVFFAWDLGADAALAAAGERLYAGSCAACHGETGRGDGPQASGAMPDFSAQDTMIFLSQAELAGRWREAHPATGADLLDLERRALLQFIRAFSYLPSWAPARLSGPGLIEGTLVQGTAGAARPPDAQVALNIYRQADLLATRRAAVDADGGFRFPDLPLDAGYYFLLETDYLGIRYTSPLLAFSGTDFVQDRVAPDRIETALPVFEKTTDPAGLRILRANWIVEHEPGSLLVGQVYTFANRGARTVTGSEREGVAGPVTLALPLPAGASEVQLQDGDIGALYRRAGRTVYDTRPVPPGDGSRLLFIRFRLPFEGDTAAVTIPLAYDADLLNILIADLPQLEAAVSVAGEAAPPAGEESVQGVLFRRWSAAAPAEATVTLSLQGLIPAGGDDPRPGAETNLDRRLPVAASPLDRRIPLAFGALVGLILAAASALAVRRQRVLAALPAAELEAHRGRLAAQIARLDDLHALGELDAPAWRRRRARLWSEMLAVARAQERDP